MSFNKFLEKISILLLYKVEGYFMNGKIKVYEQSIRSVNSKGIKMYQTSIGLIQYNSIRLFVRIFII